MRQLSLLHSRRDAKARKRGTEDQRSFGWFTIAIMLLFASMLAQQSKADSADDAEGGMLYLTSQTGRQQQALHLNTDVTINIVGLNASVTVKQLFRMWSLTRTALLCDFQ